MTSFMERTPTPTPHPTIDKSLLWFLLRASCQFAERSVSIQSQRCCINTTIRKSMSSFIDDQLEEIEVLQSIFPTEFEQLESPNKFKIHISPGCDEIHGIFFMKSDPEVFFSSISSRNVLSIFTVYRKI